VTWVEIAGYIALGLVTGAFGTLVGLGGGFIVVPVLIFSHYAPKDAAGTSLAVILANSLSGSVSYFRQRRVDVGAGVVFALAGIPGALLGGLVDQYLSGRVFSVAFAILLAVVGGRIFFTQSGGEHDPADPGKPGRYRFALVPAATIGLGAGLIASMFGIGGGLIYVPVMIYLFGFPPHVATATSHFIIALSSISGTVSHVYFHDVRWGPAIAISIGAIIGAQYGARLAQRLHHSALLRSFSIAAVLTAAWMFYQALR